ncbi:MAG: FkbM family methyltransferase [Paracoccaceae bacterium]
MQAKRVLGVVGPAESADGSDQISALSGKLDQMIKLMDESVHLQRVALLEDGHILRFHAGVTDVALSLPDAQDDYVQRVILRTRTFYEARLLANVRAMGLIGPEVAVCDIGANIGNHSVYFGKILGAKRVVCFEPQPHCYATLCRNLDLNTLGDALAYNCMVGPTSGRGEVTRFNARNLGSTAFAPAAQGAIPMVALDDLIEADELQGLGFIKIDVEGMQLGVLAGARRVIETFKPAIWVELLERDNAFPATAQMLGGMGYTSVRIGPNDHIFTPTP